MSEQAAHITLDKELRGHLLREIIGQSRSCGMIMGIGVVMTKGGRSPEDLDDDHDTRRCVLEVAKGESREELADALCAFAKIIRSGEASWVRSPRALETERAQAEAAEPTADGLKL